MKFAVPSSLRFLAAVALVGPLAGIAVAQELSQPDPDANARQTLQRFVERIEAPELGSLDSRRRLGQTLPLHALAQLGPRDEKTSILVNGAVRWVGREPDSWSVHLLARRFCEEGHAADPLAPLAEALLAHPAPSVRRSATCFFADRGEEGAGPLLARLPLESDVAVRIAMIDSLARTGAYDFMDEFASVMLQGDEDLAAWLLIAASLDLTEEQLKATAARAQTGSLGVRRLAVTLLARARADEELKRKLAAEVWQARGDRALEDAMLLDLLVPQLIPADEARAVVERRLRDPDRDVRRTALAVVASSDEERLVDDILAMSDVSTGAAIDAAHALGRARLREIDARRVASFLTEAARDEEDELRHAALGAMVRQGPDGFVDTFRDVARDASLDFESRRLAAAGLQRQPTDQLTPLVAELAGRVEESEFAEWLNAVGLVLAEGYPIDLPGLPDWALPAWEPRWVLEGERASTRTVRCERSVPGTSTTRATRRIEVPATALPIDFYDDGQLEVVRIRGEAFPDCWVATDALRSLDVDEAFPPSATGGSVSELDVAVDEILESSLARLEAAGVIERFDPDDGVVGVRIDWASLDAKRLEWLRIATDLVDSGFLRAVRAHRETIRELHGSLEGWEPWFGRGETPDSDGPSSP